jgi:drug/metabolite transporter (DMT)-like permease
LPAVRGGLLALVAAVLFGVSTPLVQKFGTGVDAFATAALLYAGAAVAGALLRQRVEREARVVRGDLTRLLAMAAAGAVVGPVALAWGLQRTSGASASLMLTLEALFTAVLAWRFYLSRGIQISPAMGIENSPPWLRFGLFRPDEASLQLLLEPVRIAADVKRHGVMQ